jgi:hypothetical protein
MNDLKNLSSIFDKSHNNSIVLWTFKPNTEKLYYDSVVEINKYATNDPKRKIFLDIITQYQKQLTVAYDFKRDNKLNEKIDVHYLMCFDKMVKYIVQTYKELQKNYKDYFQYKNNCINKWIKIDYHTKIINMEIQMIETYQYVIYLLDLFPETKERVLYFCLMK